jgi:tetratricopeptide (TPR) repeat protein
MRCDYDAAAYYDADADAAWRRLMARNIAYYVSLDPAAYTVPQTPIDRTLNQLNGPMLERVQRSGLFDLATGIPQHPEVLLYRRVDRVARGRALSDGGQHDAAVAELERATALEPGNVEAWANLALACERQGNTQKAADAFAEARRLNPRHYWANLGAARNLARLRQWAPAQASAEQAASTAPGVPEQVGAMVLAADISFAAGKAEHGCARLRDAGALKASADIQKAMAARGCRQ